MRIHHMPKLMALARKRITDVLKEELGEKGQIKSTIVIMANYMKYTIFCGISTLFLHLMPAKILIILVKIAIILARGAYFWEVLTNCKIR
jgi:hypothetical protein